MLCGLFSTFSARRLIFEPCPTPGEAWRVCEVKLRQRPQCAASSDLVARLIAEIKPRRRRSIPYCDNPSLPRGCVGHSRRGDSLSICHDARTARAPVRPLRGADRSYARAVRCRAPEMLVAEEGDDERRLPGAQACGRVHNGSPRGATSLYPPPSLTGSRATK